MNNLIDQIKKHYNIAAYVAPYTDGLRPPAQTAYGQYLNGWCPWCQNGVSQPGQPRLFWVNTDTQICNCFRPRCASQKPMDVINFHARLWGTSNSEAIEDLRLLMDGIKVVR